MDVGMGEESETTEGGGQGRGITSLRTKNKMKQDEIKEGRLFLAVYGRWEK